jgi:integrase/recombinase XerC
MDPFFLLNDFEIYLNSEKRVSNHTLVAYIKDIRDFIHSFSLTNQNEMNEVSFQVLRSWLVELVESGLSNRTINRKISSVRMYFKWLIKNKYILIDPTTRLKGPKTEKRLPTFIKQSELSSDALSDIFPNNNEGLRDRLFIELFYQTGIRLSELISLKTSSVTTTMIKVLGKRNKERLIPISDNLSMLIKVYLTCKTEDESKSPFLFTLKNGDKLYPKFVYRKINYYLGLITTIEKKSPHVLRHSFATHMLNNGAGLETLKNILGHASLAATQVYTHSSFAQLNSIYSSAHPRGHNKT